MMSDHRVVGAAFAVITTAVPDALMQPVEKILIAMVTALLTGICYRIGTLIAEKIRDRGRRPTDRPDE
jgi:hypothetical protein